MKIRELNTGFSASNQNGAPIGVPASKEGAAPSGVLVLSASQRSWLENSVAQVGHHDVPSGLGNQTPSVLHPLRAQLNLVPIPAKKPEPGSRPLKLSESVGALALIRSGNEGTADGYPPLDAWRESLDGSVVMHTRQALDQWGLKDLDGRGVKVWAFEPRDPLHNEVVLTPINDPQFGLAPGASVQLTHNTKSHLEIHAASADVMGKALEGLTQKLRDGTIKDSELKEQFVEVFVPLFKPMYDTAYADTTEIIKNFTNSDAQILNMSISTKNTAYGLAIAQNNARGVIKHFPDLAEALARHGRTTKPMFLGTPMFLSAHSPEPEIVSLLAQAARKGRQSTDAHRAYVAATQTAARAGKIIVVSADNGQQDVDLSTMPGITLSNEFSFSPFGQSDHVIVVGASNANGTPLDVLDDKVAAFSSHGDARYPVTTTTQGEKVAVPYSLFVAAGGDINGTSFSAPTVAALAALYKQAHPGGSFEDFKDLLVRYSVRNPSQPEAAQGAGILDPLGVALQIGRSIDQPRPAAD